MLKNVSVSRRLNPWKKNFQKNQHLPVITESSIIGLDLLQDFLKQANTECRGFNGLRIYFIRYDTKTDKLKSGQKQITKLPNSKFSQVSLAIVPVKNFNPATLDGEDFSKGDRILTLAFCHPSESSSKSIGTGHCPPICK